MSDTQPIIIYKSKLDQQADEAITKAVNEHPLGALAVALVIIFAFLFWFKRKSK